MTPAYDHPVVIAAQSILKAAEDGQLVLDAPGAALLTFGLRKHAADPTLPAAIVALYELAGVLIEKKRSPDAGLRLLECIRAVAPELACLSVVDEAKTSSALGHPIVKAAPPIDAESPEGSVRVASMVDPGNQVPASLRRRGR